MSKELTLSSKPNRLYIIFSRDSSKPGNVICRKGIKTKHRAQDVAMQFVGERTKVDKNGYAQVSKIGKATVSVKVKPVERAVWIDGDGKQVELY